VSGNLVIFTGEWDAGELLLLRFPSNLRGIPEQQWDLHLECGAAASPSESTVEKKKRTHVLGFWGGSPGLLKDGHAGSSTNVGSDNGVIVVVVVLIRNIVVVIVIVLIQNIVIVVVVVLIRNIVVRFDGCQGRVDVDGGQHCQSE
jgi:hypothetical protein